MASPTAAGRRSSEQVRGLLMDAARASFRDAGYRATTKDIAARAGVAESVIYTRFGSKAELFRVTVVSAFTEFIDRWVASWESAGADGDLEQMAAGYLDALYDLARDHRDLLRALMTSTDGADGELGDIAGRVARHFANSLGRVQRVVRLGAAARGYPLDEPVTLAASTAMAIAMAVFDDWFLPDECRRADRARVTAELRALCLHGITGRPPY